MNQEINRLLMELERIMREINHTAINPEINQLTLDGMRPILSLVANARARYLKALFDLGVSHEGANTRPTDEQFAEIHQLRSEYDELMNGAKELETAIQRGYLDVVSTKP